MSGEKLTIFEFCEVETGKGRRSGSYLFNNKNKLGSFRNSVSRNLCLGWVRRLLVGTPFSSERMASSPERSHSPPPTKKARLPDRGALGDPPQGSGDHPDPAAKGLVSQDDHGESKPPNPCWKIYEKFDTKENTRWLPCPFFLSLRPGWTENSLGWKGAEARQCVRIRIWCCSTWFLKYIYEQLIWEFLPGGDL